MCKSNNYSEILQPLELQGKYAGQTAEVCQARLEEGKDGVIFIDEVYSLLAGRNEDSTGPGQEAIDAIRCC